MTADIARDLQAIHGALSAAGIDFLLVRGENQERIIVADLLQRSTIKQLLSDSCELQAIPITVLPPEGALVNSSAGRIFRLCRTDFEPNGSHSEPNENTLELHFWDFQPEMIVCPAETSMTRCLIPVEELDTDTVELYGLRWQTIRGMFDAHASDVLFDIDIVFSWVDGNDPHYQKTRLAQMTGHVSGDGDDSDARYRHVDELKYALRSVHLFAPWLRNIFIVTDSARPSWLAEHPRVSIVRSAEFFRDPTVLPTHNSHALESQLHRIPGLSEYFLYSNDDMFFARPVHPKMFFSPGGVTRFIESGMRIGLGKNNQNRSGFENSARVNRELLQKRFGRLITRHLEHAPTPFRKSIFFELENEFANDFNRTAASRFRSHTDISVTNSLYHYYALLTGRAVAHGDARVGYVDTVTRSGLAVLAGILASRSDDFICLNDGSHSDVSAEERAECLTQFLEKYFSSPAPWETPSSPP